MLGTKYRLLTYNDDIIRVVSEQNSTKNLKGVILETDKIKKVEIVNKKQNLVKMGENYFKLTPVQVKITKPIAK